MASAPQIPTGSAAHWSEKAAATAWVALITALLTVVATIVKACLDAESARTTARALADLARRYGVDPATLGVPIPRFQWPFVTIVAGSATVLAAIVALVAANHRDSRAAVDRSPRDLAGCLHILHAWVLKRKGIAAERQEEALRAFRLTLHVVVDEERYQQVVNYVGGPPDKAKCAGRIWSTKMGLVGRVIRYGTSDPMLMSSMSDGEGFLAELVKDYGYSREEARDLTPGRRSAMVVPITKEGGAVIACVYADSSEVGWFSEEIQEIMVAGTEAVASFARVRYHGTS